MWWGSEGSGGEGSKEPPPPNQEDMKERYEQQQLLLAQLKEMLRKSEQSSSVSREKVEEYASTLSEINARAKLSKIKRSEGRKPETEDLIKTTTTTTSSSKKSLVVTPAKEKINLLQQQLAENRLKLAQRDKNQKDIEEMFNQLKAQLDSQETEPLAVQEETHHVTAPIDLTVESSKEDLLNAIKCKDDHITELTTKMQQLQANVLDLQENIKEKDSVIDARTKAITLLSENLSKKGKNTLDMLDETKEQMRHMQENFVQIENDMKEQLSNKDKVIRDLEESNSALKSANIELEQKLTNLTTDLEKYRIDLEESENKVKQLTKINEELETKLSQSPGETSEPSTPQKTAGKRAKGKNKKGPYSENIEDAKDKEKEEIAKLMKQLDEMNKNMIKMKAQHKAKLKEMQKKSSPIEQDQADKVAILEQRLAEVEEDKGNLQLRLVDLESNNKEKEYIADLENKIEDQKLEIESHISTITTLEAQIAASSNEISSLRSELSNLMHLENAQVCSEMTSVQLEEQLDKEVSQKKQIQDKYNEIVKENEHLQERIEALNKEKQELSTKLDNYMQENIELIDRLEKLSAEKVSSAESIEIVESLTQQEKLEIEAYQQSMEQPDPEADASNEISTADTHKLTEETSPSELLERIELFTAERREVMEKMDRMHAENQQLLCKYDKMVVEKDSLLTRIDQLSAENHDLQAKLKDSEANHEQEKLQEELTEYRALLENQKLQIASLQEELWSKPDSDTDAAQQSSLQQQLEEKVKELEAKVAENEEEINFLQANIEDNKSELITAAEKIAEYNKTITIKCAEIDILKNETDELQQAIMELNGELESRETSKQQEIHMYSSQLAEFKSILAEHIDQLEKYEDESKENSATIEHLNDQIEELNYKVTETQHENELKAAQLLAYASERADYEARIEHLRTELKANNEKFTEACLKLKEKCAFLQNQIQANSGSIEEMKIPFENKIKELETKNREQVEKMKKIAANLKKKSNICQELEGQLADAKEKWEHEAREKDEKLEECNVKINSLLNQLQHVEMQRHQVNEEKLAAEHKLRDLQEQIAEKDKQIGDVRNEINMIKSEAAASSKEVIQSLSTQLEEMKLRTETAQNAMEAKLQEKDMFIEHLEAESNKFKEKVNKLEEGLSSIMERRQSLEEHAFDLKVQLEEKSSACEEAFQTEDILEQRLIALMEHDKVIEQKLKHSTSENQSLHDKLKATVEENERLDHKIVDLHSMLEETSAIKEKLEHYENECTRLTAHITNIENEKKKIQNDYERKVSEKNIEIENMETELNAQLQELHAERKNILNRCEVLQDTIKEYVDNEQLINQEIAQLQQKLVLTKEELEFKVKENLELTQSISDQLMKIEQLENTQNSPTVPIANDNEPHLQAELERLQKVIADKDLDIENYQRQNMQLQMAASFNAPPGPNLFESTAIDSTDLKASLDESNARCNDYQQQLKELTTQYNQIQTEINHYQQIYNQLQEMYNTAQQEIINQQTTIHNLQQELAVRKTAENNVQDIISTAVQSVSEEMIQKTTANLFHHEPQHQKPVESVFDDIALQSQIISEKTIQQDHSIPEFDPINVNINVKDVVDRTELPQPVIEEAIHPKTAYLCYPEPNTQNQEQNEGAWGWGTEDQKIRETLESQIVPAEEIKISPEEKKVFQQWEYGPVTPLKDTSKQPVDERVQDPRHAYLCYPEPKNVDTFASEEDGWGWNAEEAKLEAEHRQSLGQLDTGKIQQLEDQIHVLEVERDRLLEEVKTQQVRSGKLIKKLKQVKENYDKLVEKSKTDDFGLDMAIQDELNAQIKALEKKLKETREENTKDKAEIENYKQRLDVLQAANERMIEIKEKTDNEIQFLQFKNRELTSKLEQLEWGDDSPKKIIQEDVDDLAQKQSEDTTKKIQELNATIQELTLDNEEMQLILEEQRRMRIEAEKALTNIPILEGMKPEQEFIKLENEILQLNELNRIAEEKSSKLLLENEELNAKANHLQLNIENLVQENNMMNHEAQLKIEHLQNEYIELQNQLQTIDAENEHLKQQEINSKQTELIQLREELLQVQQQKHNFERDYFEKQNILESVQLDIVTVKNEKLALETELEEKEIAIQHLNNKIEQLIAEKNSLDERIQQFANVQNEKDSCIQQLNMQIQQLVAEKLILDQQIQEKQNLDMDLNEKDSCIQQLNMQIQQLVTEKLILDQQIQEKQNLDMDLNDKDSCIQQLNMQIQQLVTEKSILDQQIQEKQNLDMDLNEKDICIQRLNSKIDELEAEKISLNQRIQEGNEKLMASLQNFETKTEENMSSTIEELTRIWTERVDQRGNDVAESWKLHLETVENEFSQREAKLKMELNDILMKNEEIIHQNNELQKQVELIISEKQSFINDNNEMIQSLQQNLNTKQSEITEISRKLYELNSELEMKNNEIKTLNDASDLIKIKEMELEEAVFQLEQKISECKNYENQLEIKNQMIKDLEMKLNELNVLSQDERNQIVDLRNIIENQVLKIEELKGEIEEKNNEYNALVAEFDNFEQMYLKGDKPDPSLMENVDNFATEEQVLNPGRDQANIEIDSANAPVNRAELDLALYMLHQRDVRCEELTVELMQLLEERDTLQLKLSNAIRLNEELRIKSNENLKKDTTSIPKVDTSTGAIPKSKAIVLGATGTELATEATESIAETPGDLNKKLSELKSIGYRDKTLKEDQEFRHIQQMSLMQQHRDLAAKLPAEAAARLVDANYTLSRDVQSPSKVLLNWLWGRSTPKVNDV